MTPSSDTAPVRVAGVVLAGGAGRRMGGGKPFRLLGDKPLVAHVVDRMRPQVDRLWISVRDDAGPFRGFGLPILADNAPAVPGGALAAIVTALEAASGEGFDLFATAPCDTPFLPSDLVRRLRAGLPAGTAPGIVVCSSGRLHPTLGLWRATALPLLQRAFARGERHLAALCDEAGVVELDAEEAGWRSECFLNVNTPNDLARAQALLGRWAAQPRRLPPAS